MERETPDPRCQAAPVLPGLMRGSCWFFGEQPLLEMVLEMVWSSETVMGSSRGHATALCDTLLICEAELS